MTSPAADRTDAAQRLGAASLADLLQIAAALLLGAFIIFGASFAPMTVVHNATHDARHSFAFPCH